jgi:hypothetical protein
MVVCHLPYGPTAYFGVFNTVLRHDIGQKKEVGTISEAYPHLVMEKMDSQLGQRIASILKHLFPVPKDDSKRVVTFANADDYISFRHHVYSAPKGAKSIELKEVRPGCRHRYDRQPQAGCGVCAACFGCVESLNCLCLVSKLSYGHSKYHYLYIYICCHSCPSINATTLLVPSANSSC